MITLPPVPSDLSTWNYQDSVDSVRKIFVGSYRKVSTELIEELYQAKLQLNRGPGNPHQRLSWAAYCREAMPDVTVKTVDTWIKRHEIGEQAWNDMLAAKAKIAPVPVDDEALFVVKQILNKDGTFTIRLLLSEYPKTVFEEQIVA